MVPNSFSCCIRPAISIKEPAMLRFSQSQIDADLEGAMTLSSSPWDTAWELSCLHRTWSCRADLAILSSTTEPATSLKPGPDPSTWGLEVVTPSWVLTRTWCMDPKGDMSMNAQQGDPYCIINHRHCHISDPSNLNCGVKGCWLLRNLVHATLETDLRMAVSLVGPE
jgi:hypothetical protein